MLDEYMFSFFQLKDEVFIRLNVAGTALQTALLLTCFVIWASSKIFEMNSCLIGKSEGGETLTDCLSEIAHKN